MLARDLAAALAPVAGLRNRLVHEYDAIVDAIVLDAAGKAQELFPQYIAAIETYLKHRSSA
ncbi:MAG TPA: HepT-like ribonuclease domain-containing protein [Nitrospiraceae bacterium]|nr:HepT-like ribonuclease domain-containing protein [Nitrospiraceae bacterium]